MEFLVRQIDNTPLGKEEERAAVRPAEREYATQLRADGVLRHLWRVPGTRDAIGWYEAKDTNHLHDVLTGLPSFPFIKVEIETLAIHPQEMQN